MHVPTTDLIPDNWRHRRVQCNMKSHRKMGIEWITNVPQRLLLLHRQLLSTPVMSIKTYLVHLLLPHQRLRAEIIENLLVLNDT